MVRWCLLLVVVTIMNKKTPDNCKLDGGMVRMTRQRRVILDQMQSTDEHLDADEIYQRVRLELPRISMGTVYRNIEILSRAGLIKRLDLGGRRKLYDGGVHHHYHVQCSECGEVSDISAESFRQLESLARSGSDYKILGHDLRFEGLCPKCQKST